MTFGALGVDRGPKGVGRGGWQGSGLEHTAGARGHGHGAYPGQGAAQGVPLAFQNVPLELGRAHCLPG